MKNSNTTHLKNSGAWQIFAIGPSGIWTGFKAPVNRLKQLTMLASILLILCAFSLTGWLLSRWRSENLSRQLSAERLKVRALEQEIRNPLVNQQSGFALPAQISFLPSLAAEELRSTLVEIKNFTAGFNAEKKEFSIDFELSRDKTLQNAASYYWMALLHGNKGILAFPAALGSQRGELLQYKKAEFLENVRDKKLVAARFAVGDYIKDSGPEAIYASLYIYNDQGSLLVTQRKELSLR